MTPSGYHIEVGCGTGRTAGHLAGPDLNVRATDLDPEMIGQAREKGYPDVGFAVLGMLETLEAEAPGVANGILCLGNTLPHLADRREAEHFFSESFRVLAPGGLLVIQILNYRRIITEGRLSMPDLESGGLLFRRRQEYRPDEERVIFHTEVDDGSRVESRSHRMLPRRFEELNRLAAEGGLRPDGSGSAWDGTPVRDDSIWFYAAYLKDGT